MDFKTFPKIARLKRGMVVTEKIDGTNALVAINEDCSVIRAGSRSRWITPEADNYGFARWVQEHRYELLGLGHGFHYGEWWGQGIQRRYGLQEKRFSLFNVGRWNAETPPPSCCHTVPVLYRGDFSTEKTDLILQGLAAGGSVAAPGFMDPEGIVVFHVASSGLYKRTIKNDSEPKGRKS